MRHPTRFVYFACPRDEQPIKHVKIGITKDLNGRLKFLRLRLLFAVECESRFARDLEKALHVQFDYARFDAWDDRRIKAHINYGGFTEWFELDYHLRQLIWIVWTSGKWPWDKTQRVVVG